MIEFWFDEYLQWRKWSKMHSKRRERKCIQHNFVQNCTKSGMHWESQFEIMQNNQKCIHDIWNNQHLNWFKTIKKEPKIVCNTNKIDDNALAYAFMNNTDLNLFCLFRQFQHNSMFTLISSNQLIGKFRRRKKLLSIFI